MTHTRNTKNYNHLYLPKTGILLTNLGTPDAPTPAALRRYLHQFLWDPRVIEMHRTLWWLILHGIILRIRPARSAKSYRKIWTAEGSPLLNYSLRQRDQLRRALPETQIELGMRYGNPSIPAALETLRTAGITHLLVLPLYPQYSASTTASTFDAVTETLKHWRWLPEFRFISHYHDHPAYIHALAEKIKNHWQQQKPADKLLFSFHGVPKRYLDNGDPYHCECHKTARLTAEALGIPADKWQVVFQSRFGREEWLKPYLDHTLKALPAQNIKSVDIICPGFAADCLETLEEVNEENRHYYLHAGGEKYHYIPALNDDPGHIHALTQILQQHMQNWNNTPHTTEQQQTTRARAIQHGAQP